MPILGIFAWYALNHTQTPLAEPSTWLGWLCRAAIHGVRLSLCYGRRLAEEEIIKHITTTDADIGRSQALSLLRTWYLKTPSPKPSLTATSNRSAALPLFFLTTVPAQHWLSQGGDYWGLPSSACS